MVISTHVLDTITSHTLCWVTSSISGCGSGDRHSLARRSLYWLGRRYRACLAPLPSPCPVYLTVQANRNKVCAVRTERRRKNGSRCLEASYLDRILQILFDYFICEVLLPFISLYFLNL